MPKKRNPIEKLADEHGGYWEGEHDDFPVSDWKYEVRNEDTRQGYWEWVANKVEATADEEG